jgi:hypothetical protein
MRAFQCREYGARLTLAACALNLSAARDPVRGGAGAGAHILRRPCLGCEVGAAHELGREPARWPDGSPVVRVSLSRHDAPPPQERPATAVPEVPGPLARPKPEKPKKVRQRGAPRHVQRASSGRRGEVYEWRGHRGGVYELSRLPEVVALGITPQMIWARVHDGGWSIERALTTPKTKSAPPRYRGAVYQWRGRFVTAGELHDTPEAREIGITKKALWLRLSRLSWDAERAITEPLDSKKQVRWRRA